MSGCRWCGSALLWLPAEDKKGTGIPFAVPEQVTSTTEAITLERHYCPVRTVAYVADDLDARTTYARRVAASEKVLRHAIADNDCPHPRCPAITGQRCVNLQDVRQGVDPPRVNRHPHAERTLLAAEQLGIDLNDLKDD